MESRELRNQPPDVEIHFRKSAKSEDGPGNVGLRADIGSFTAKRKVILSG